MERYVYSGSLTDGIVEYMQRVKSLKPIDALVSQVDRSGVTKMIEYYNKGVIKSFFLDSGAFSIHTGKANLTVDDYIEYANQIDKYCWGIAQLDTIPGKLFQPKTPQDYEESAQKSWENFLYMHERLNSPEKLLPVFHQGEDPKYLIRMLDWRGPNGEKIEYLGLSPSNDRAQSDKNIYLANMYDIIAKSTNPTVKTHLFGCTSIDALLQFPCYSADSISHRLQAAYGKIYTRKWGVITVSGKTFKNKTRGNQNFLQVCDDKNRKELLELIGSYGFTEEEIREVPSARIAFNIREIQRTFEERQYVSYRTGRPRKFF